MRAKKSNALSLAAKVGAKKKDLSNHMQVDPFLALQIAPSAQPSSGGHYSIGWDLHTYKPVAFQIIAGLLIIWLLAAEI
jgi:hypothetical protein